jgi:hypothetical protein
MTTIAFSILMTIASIFGNVEDTSGELMFVSHDECVITVLDNSDPYAAINAAQQAQVDCQ